MGAMEEAVRTVRQMFRLSLARGSEVRVPGVSRRGRKSYGGPEVSKEGRFSHGLSSIWLRAIFVITLCLIPAAALGQGISISGQVVDQTGAPLPNATIVVCPSTGAGIPCSPPAAIYSSPTLSSGSALPNPTTADQYGNYSLFVAPNYYIVQIEVSGTVVYSYLQGFAVSGSGSIFGTQPAYNVFANCTGSTAFPSFCMLNASMIPATLNATTINGLTVVGNANLPTIVGPTSLIGTLAVSSTLSANGETLTGALSGTTAAFSGLVTAPTTTVTTSNATTLNVSSISTLATLSATSFSLSGSQSATGFQGTSGTKLTTALGSFSNPDVLCANTTSDIADCGFQMPNGAATYNLFVTASGPGTTVGTLTKLTGSPSTAVIAATTDLGGIVGITILKPGISSLVQQSGIAACIFDGAVTAGDYTQISSTVQGNCHDSGVAPPTSAPAGQLIGYVLSTHGSGGTYNVLLSLGGGTQVTRTGHASACVVGGNSCGTVVTWNNGGFTDTNYSAVCSIVGTTLPVPGNAYQIFVLGYNSKTSTTIQPIVQDLLSSTASVTLDCVGVHD